MYVERYVSADAGPEELAKPAAEGLKGLIEVALKISKLNEFLGRDHPTVITVSLNYRHQCVCILSDNDRFPQSNRCQYLKKNKIGEPRIYQNPSPRKHYFVQ